MAQLPSKLVNHLERTTLKKGYDEGWLKRPLMTDRWYVSAWFRHLLQTKLGAEVWSEPSCFRVGQPDSIDLDQYRVLSPSQYVGSTYVVLGVGSTEILAYADALWKMRDKTVEEEE